MWVPAGPTLLREPIPAGGSILQELVRSPPQYNARSHYSIWDYPGHQYSGAHLLRGSLHKLQWTGDAAVLYLIDKSVVGYAVGPPHQVILIRVVV
jgi:hypothetical protein